MSFRPLPILSVVTIVSLVILYQLGAWQYHRYSSKIDAVAPATLQRSEQTFELRRLGQPDVPVQQVYGLIDGEPVWRQYGAAEVMGEPGWVLVLYDVSGGYEPSSRTLASFPETLSLKANKVDPETRLEQRNVNGSDPAAGLWYSFRLEGLSKQLGFADLPTGILEPVLITITHGEAADRRRQTLNPYAFAEPPDPLPAERHFGYALTWWGMAIGLFVVYLAFHHAQGRLRFRS